MNKIRDAEPIHWSNLEEGKEYILKARAEGLVKLVKKVPVQHYPPVEWEFEILDGSVWVGGKPERKGKKFTMSMQRLQAVQFYERV